MFESVSNSDSPRSDFDELLSILHLERLDSDTFIGAHPSKNPIRTFGGQMLAQAFVAAGRSLERPLPPSMLSAHFIAGGDPKLDLEFHVVRLRDERRFANRRVDVIQQGRLLTTVLASYLAGGRGLEHGVEAPQVEDPLSLPPIDELLRGYEDVVPHFADALRPLRHEPYIWRRRQRRNDLQHQESARQRRNLSRRKDTNSRPLLCQQLSQTLPR